MFMIPEFDINGNLPPGIHQVTWEEFTKRFGRTQHRCKLLSGLKRALDSLKAAGCQTVYVDGSFVTEKKVPGDFDACWDINGVNPDLLDPVLLTFANRRAAQKAKYSGELFPMQATAENITGRTFLEFFQIDKKTGEQKGIIQLDLRRL
jgi:hypothetical protein